MTDTVTGFLVQYGTESSINQVEAIYTMSQEEYMLGLNDVTPPPMVVSVRLRCKTIK